jgi:hypothetical protein
MGGRRFGDVAIRHNRGFPLHDEKNFAAGVFVDFDRPVPLPGWHADFGESDEGGANVPTPGAGLRRRTAPPHQPVARKWLPFGMSNE